MIRQHHQLNRHEFEQTLGDSGRQEAQHVAVHGVHKDSDATQQLNKGS